jgi:phage tail-like protein
MDVNGTRFHLVLGRADWSGCGDGQGHLLRDVWDASPPAAPAAIDWDDSHGELTLMPMVYEFPVPPVDKPPQLADRRGAGRDAAGNWYWIGSDGATVYVTSVGDGSTTTFWPGHDARTPAPSGESETFAPLNPAPAAIPQSLQGGAVTDDQFLVLGTLAPGGLLVFDLLTGGPPTHLPWPDGSPFTPFDIAARPGGGVFVLDVEHSLAWEFDRNLHVLAAQEPAPLTPPPGSFAPVVDDGAPPVPLRAVTVTAATAVGGDPIAIESLPDGGFVILDLGTGAGSLAVRYANGAPVGEPVPLADAAAGIAVTGFDFALAGDTLLVVDEAGKQSFGFTLSTPAGGLAVTLQRDYYPMRLFGGKALVAAGGGAWYDCADRWVPLTRQPRASYGTSGTILTPVLDGREPGCVWHRLMLDAIVPAGSGVAVFSAAADELDSFAAPAWQPEPDPRPRGDGPEIPFADIGLYRTHELLFQRATGRYLQVRLELIGDGRSTPRLRALRAWYPRFSYLSHYLPAVYREEPTSAAFMDRYLANVEGIATAAEDRIAAAQVLLNPACVPSDALAWLAGWLDLALDPLWDERRSRVMLAKTMQFYAARGTIRGIDIALRFVLDACADDSAFAEQQPPALASPRIVETFRTRRTPGVVFGDTSQLVSSANLVPGGRWDPTAGRDALISAYSSYLQAAGMMAAAGGFPILDPGDATSAAWQSFSGSVLGFVPQPADPAQWGGFLERRYANVQSLESAYALMFAAASLRDVPPPTTLPDDGAALVDWFQFQGVVLPTASHAHRFTVLLPWPLSVHDASGAALSQDDLRALATRIVTLQQPAHTIFDVKFFWAAFRVGEVRLASDTVLASGSRAPELLEPSLVGSGHLGTALLSGTPPSDRVQRTQSPDPSSEKEPS